MTTKLLTLLNVSATKVGKRKDLEEFVPSKKKLNKRKTSISFAETVSVYETDNTSKDKNVGPIAQFQIENSEEVENDNEVNATGQFLVLMMNQANDPFVVGSNDDAYETQFGLKPIHLTDISRASVDSHSWKRSSEKVGQLGSVTVLVPQNTEAGTSSCSTDVNVSYNDFYF